MNNAGCSDCVLVQTWGGDVRRNLVHTQRPPVAMESEDSGEYLREADVLLIHVRVGWILYRQ